jgi:ApaG protein
MMICWLMVGMACALLTQLLINKEAVGAYRRATQKDHRRGASPRHFMRQHDRPAPDQPAPPAHVLGNDGQPIVGNGGEPVENVDEAKYAAPKAPPPRPPPRRPPSAPPLPPPLQPDELRRQASALEATSMRCDEAIPPESIFTTREGDATVTVHAKSSYRHLDDTGLHAFGYHVEFVNAGISTVQLLSRHWVFVDANGKVEEMKGPGAKGMLPIVKPGEKFSYSSGTRIATERGSMHGYFTFEAVATGRVFSVRVGRLALSSGGSSALVPCAEAADGTRTLPTTSVHSTDRVIVGANTELASHDEDMHTYSFSVDLQVNNARSEPVYISHVWWEIVDANGQKHEAASSVGTSGEGGQPTNVVRLPPGMAMRLKASLPKISTPHAKVSGMLRARFGDPAAALSSDDEDLTPVFGEGGAADGEEEQDEEEDEATRERTLIIAPLGCSVSGDSVQAFEPLGFLPGMDGRLPGEKDQSPGE